MQRERCKLLTLSVWEGRGASDVTEFKYISADFESKVESKCVHEEGHYYYFQRKSVLIERGAHKTLHPPSPSPNPILVLS